MLDDTVVLRPDDVGNFVEKWRDCLLAEHIRRHHDHSIQNTVVGRKDSHSDVPFYCVYVAESIEMLNNSSICSSDMPCHSSSPTLSVSSLPLLASKMRKTLGGFHCG